MAKKHAPKWAFHSFNFQKGYGVITGPDVDTITRHAGMISAESCHNPRWENGECVLTITNLPEPEPHKE